MSALPPFRAAALVAAAVVLCLAPGCSSATDAAPTEVTGRIVDLQGEGSEIEAFTVDGDERVELWIADDVNYGFDLGHLREHQATGDPVRCTVEERDGRLYALSIADG